MKTVFKAFLHGVIAVLVMSLAFPAYATEKITFYHTDPVGTPLAISDSAGQKVWEADYKPFGEEFFVSETPDDNNRRFVGKEKDAESGLSYFGARYLYSTSGRFLSPDPIRAVKTGNGEINVSFLMDPQHLNLYSYSLNNPSKFVDPDGLTVRIKSKDKKTKVLRGTNKEIRKEISKYKNGSINSVEIVGHGNREGIDTNSGDYIYYDSEKGVIYGDDQSSFSDSLRDKLAEGASVSLKGCQTAREGWPFASDNDHITKKLSEELSGVQVVGYRGFGFSNEMSNPFNRKQSVRLGKDLHAVGATKTYLNGIGK